MILLSLHPGPPSETSAFRRMRAFSSRLAGPLPLRTSACSCSRSCALNRTTYFFTAMSFPAMIPSAARIAARANHLILSNWLKLATRHIGDPIGQSGAALVEQDEPRESGKPGQKAGERRFLPNTLDIRYPPQDEHEVMRPRAQNLVCDVDAAAGSISSFGTHRAAVGSDVGLSKNQNIAP